MSENQRPSDNNCRCGGVQSQSTEPMSAVTAAGKRDGKRQKKRLTGTETEEHFAFGNQDYLWQWLVTK